MTVQNHGKLVRLREDSFSILIKQGAKEIIQYCGTRARILFGVKLFLCATLVSYSILVSF